MRLCMDSGGPATRVSIAAVLPRLLRLSRSRGKDTTHKTGAEPVDTSQERLSHAARHHNHTLHARQAYRRHRHASTVHRSCVFLKSFASRTRASPLTHSQAFSAWHSFQARASVQDMGKTVLSPQPRRRLRVETSVAAPPHSCVVGHEVPRDPETQRECKTLGSQ